jgi:DNA polymerase-3 subunit beta
MAESLNYNPNNMYLTLPLKTLKSMVDALKDNIPKSPPQEVLTNFKLEAKNDLLTITATDLKLWLIRREDCNNIKEEGAIALNAKRFSDAVKSLAGEDVEIKVSNAIATIKCGKSKFQLPVIDANKYPATPRNTDAQSFAIATDILREGFAATLKTVSSDETKQALLGVHLEEIDEVLEGEDDPTHFLCFVSADGKRGSIFKAIAPFLGGVDITIPTKAVKEVEHITQAELEISLINNHIRIESHSLTIVAPLITQKFPPIRNMLSSLRKQKLSGSVKCDRKELLESIKRVNSLSEGDVLFQSVDIFIEQDGLRMISTVEGVGLVEESMSCDIGSGKFRSLFNPKYLQCILDTTRAKHVKLEAYDGPQRCVFITPCDDKYHETFLMAKVDMNKQAEDDDDEDDED